jgi:uncharacterized protein
MHVFYLHGFASSARSGKATYFRSKLEARGITLETPDFNEPDFSTLTITRMIEQVVARIDAVPDQPIALIGSSLGAFVAVQVAIARPARVARLVLLAPALDFGGNRMRQLGDVGLEEWKRAGRLNVFHYAYGRMMPVHYELYADARGYDCVGAQLRMPTQIFQGERDDSVDPISVKEWASARPSHVELHMLDDDHQLQGSLDRIWKEMERFLGLNDD